MGKPKDQRGREPLQQNWLHALVFSDDVGVGYVASLSVACGFLCDIALNRAPVASAMLNAVFGALGSSVWVAPC